MQRFILRPSSKNQVTIPKPVRDALGVKPLEPIAAVVSGKGRVTLMPAHEFTVEELAGILPSLNPPPSLDFDDEIYDAQQEMAEEIVREMGGL